MKKLNNNNVKSIIMLVILIALPSIFVLAGPRDLGGDPGGAPIDGGISLLVAAGIGYGVKKVKDSRKKAKQPAPETGAK